jgi:hypothetical protein
MIVIFIACVIILTLTSPVGFMLWGVVLEKIPRRHHWSCTCGANGALWARASAPALALVGRAVLRHDDLIVKENLIAIFDICKHRITVHYEGPMEETRLELDHDKAPRKEA